MKKYKISLLVLATVASMPSYARVSVKNSGRSYADAYNQVNAMRYQQEYMNATAIPTATTASATADLPVLVNDKKLAAAILNNTSQTTIDDLDACAMIYPNGVFQWDIPESGIRAEKIPQCVAVINLVDATTKAVLATTTLAAGDSMKCNVDSFPESGMSLDLKKGKVEVPADAAPTLEDVERVMNEEQKDNAGVKIAAGAIISAVAGNMLAPKTAGNTGTLGTSKTQLVDTAIGAAAGAGIMAASTYSGKVAGDTIRSTAVNAASGMIVGNMMAGMNSGNDVLDVKKCLVDNVEKDCIPGRVSEKGQKIETDASANHFYIIDQSGNIKHCEPDKEGIKCTNDGKRWIDIELVGSSYSYNEIFKPGHIKNEELGHLARYKVTDVDAAPDIFEPITGLNQDGQFYRIASAYETKNEKHAYIVFDSALPSKLTGLTEDDFAELNAKPHKYYERNSDGTVGREITPAKSDSDGDKKTVDNLIFKVATIDATDGGLVDLSNKSRVKGTLVGTAAGGAMGGMAGYQGAKSEITDRWTAAVREYQDSLTTVVCTTGGRFLSAYNDYVEIPTPKKITEE